MFPFLGWGCVSIKRVGDVSPAPCISHPIRGSQTGVAKVFVWLSLRRRTGGGDQIFLSIHVSALKKERRKNTVWPAAAKNLPYPSLQKV